MLMHYGREVGVKMARKHLGWYTKGLPGSAEFRNRVNFVDHADEVMRSLREFYAPFLETSCSPAKAGASRGDTAGSACQPEISAFAGTQAAA
jgi:tRNA-dihydrouridine synthase B